MAIDKTEINMTQGTMTDKIAKFALPLVLSGILQLLFNTADSVVVGRYAGEAALAAVGSNGPMINLIINLFIGLSLGATITVSRYYGENNEDGMQKSVHTTIAISLICGVFLAVLGNILAGPLLRMIGVPDEVLPLSKLYMRIYFSGMPFNMLYNFASGIMRSYGDTRRPLYYLTIAGIINVVLNLVFVIAFKMSVAGVALATIISQAVSSVLVLLTLTKVNNGCRINLKKLAVHKNQLFMMIRAGVPSGIQSSMFSISNVFIQGSINSFGTNAVAAGSVSSSIEGFVYIGMNAIGNTAVTLSSQNFGAGKFRRILKGWITCVGAVAVVAAVLSVAVLAFSEPLTGMFTDNPDVIRLAIERLWYIVPGYVICGIMEVSVGMTRGIGYYIPPMLVSIFGVCGLRVLWIYTVFALSPTLPVLYTSYPVSWTITTVIQCLLFFIFIKKKERMAINHES